MARKAIGERASDYHDEWRQRLQHSHDYWRDNGLTPNQRRRPWEIDGFRYLDFYRGDQWGGRGWGVFTPDQCITVNVTAANTNAMLSRLSKNNPKVICTPTRAGAQESARIRRNELVLQYFVRELQMKRQVDRALLDALLTPFGFMQHGYSAPDDKFQAGTGRELDSYSMARAGLPWIKRRPFWDVRVDPLADTFSPDGSASWVAFRDLLSMRQIKGSKRLSFPDDLKPTKSVDLFEKKRQRRSDTTPEWYDLFEVWTLYEKTEKKWFSLSPGSSKFLMEPAEWPIPWETLPFSYLSFNEQADSNIPVPFPSLYESQQVELNKVRTIMSSLSKGQRRMLFYQRDSFIDADQKKLDAGELDLREVFAVQGSPRDAVYEVGLGGFSQELLLYDAKIKEDIREAIGLSQMDRAQRVNVETAAESNAIQLGSATQAGRNEEKFEAFWRHILQTFRQELRYTLSSDVLVSVAGEKDAQSLSEDGSFVAVTREDVQGDYDLDIRAGSTLPENHNERFAKTLQLKQIFTGDATVDQLELTSVLIEEAGFDSSRLVRSPEQLVATEQELQARGQGGPPGGSGQSKTDGLDANFLRQLGVTQ